METFLEDAFSQSPGYQISEMGPEASEAVKKLSFAGRKSLDKLFAWLALHKAYVQTLCPCMLLHHVPSSLSWSG